MEEIVRLERTDVRLALVQYRDHPPEERTYVTRVRDFTASVRTMRRWLGQATADGGGDLCEAVADGLHAALGLDWRQQATKIAVLVADSPPHGLGYRFDAFKEGRIALSEEVEQLVTREIRKNNGRLLFVIFKISKHNIFRNIQNNTKGPQNDLHMSKSPLRFRTVTARRQGLFFIHFYSTVILFRDN